MREPDRNRDDAAQVDSTQGDVGDVETAGETTAAAAINGPEHSRPVGADTMAKVDDTRDPAASDDDPARS